MRYKCLVLDHDDTVVQSEKTIGYPFFCETLRKFRPGTVLSLQDYVQDCHELGFVEMCRQRFAFTPDEQYAEHTAWTEYIKTHIPDPFPGIGSVIHRQKQAGGLICVVSHSSKVNIERDYRVHFGTVPDAVYGFDYPEHQRKPSPFSLLDIMERYNLGPKDLLVVDDVKLAWDMAHPLGIDVAFAAWSKGEFPKVAQQMQSICDYSFDTTKELETFLFD